MTSPINHINRPTGNALNNNAAKTREKTSPESTPQASTGAEDTVSLSKETTRIGELQSQLSSVSEVDQEKVDAIKQEIAKGNYPIDSQRIAENLINLEKALAE